MSRSPLSHAIRGLEERNGLRLWSRTTRSVAPTDAGEQLIGRLRPALGDLASVLDQIAEQPERPAGRPWSSRWRRRWFKKKSKSGAATPQPDIEPIKQRLKQAVEISKKKA